MTVSKNLEIQSFNYEKEVIPSIIYDNNNEEIKRINRKYKLNVTYDELPTQFILALMCAEDLRFFNHEGFDPYRIIASLINNVSNSNIQGGSTLTQQLIKNEFLSNEQTLLRKIKEFILSIELEKRMSKEEILEAYCNLILFDGITPGINNAANRFFNKNISEVNVIEACALVALVKSPTKYNPIRYPNNNKERRNLILKTMYENNYISYNIYQNAIKVETEDLLNKEKEILETYPYQAYIDIVYKQVEELTGLDPYTTPMKIYTYLDSALQKELDLIQANESEIIIKDENQQIAGAVIDNKSGVLVGVIGGKDYKGERLLNRAYDVKRQPASTMKPLLSYALAYEHLNWSNEHVVEDVPYKYPGTNISVKNVDNRYMGDIYIEEALGYSRNTTALSTLEKIINKIGLESVLDYLEDINMLDDRDSFNMSYGIGGMVYGVTPVSLAAAYATFPSEGVYRSPLTIKRIEIIDKENLDINIKEKRVLSKESAFLMNKTLCNVVNNNYWGMGTFKIENTDIAMKSGTSNFDKNTLLKLGYPNGACKDIWYAGYCKNYTISIWTGFDKNEVNKETFFYANNDSRVSIAKQIMNKIIKLKALKNETFNKPDTLYEVNIVRGVYPYVLPDELTPSYMIKTAYFKKEDIPNKVITPEPLPKLNDVIVFELDDSLIFVFDNEEKVYEEKEYGKTLYSNKMIYGDIVYNIKLPNGEIIKSTENNIEIPISNDMYGLIDCYLSYEKKEVATSHKYFTFS